MSNKDYKALSEELLEVLKEMVSYCESVKENGEAYFDALKVISKAGGVK